MVCFVSCIAIVNQAYQVHIDSKMEINKTTNYISFLMTYTPVDYELSFYIVTDHHAVLSM